jgi:hypothetical protein
MNSHWVERIDGAIISSSTASSRDAESCQLWHAIG